jgi:hypothetical protein
MIVWLWIDLNEAILTRDSSEALNIVQFWKIFLITSSRRIYSKGLALRKAKLTEF